LAGGKSKILQPLSLCFGALDNLDSGRLSRFTYSSKLFFPERED